MALPANSTGDPDADTVLGIATAPAAVTPKAASTGDPDADAVLGRSATTAAPGIKYDAAEFKRRVGREPEPAELKNFAANKGAGFAGETSSPSAMDIVADRLIGGTVRGVAGGLKGIATGVTGGDAAAAVHSITDQELQPTTKAGEVASEALASKWNPLNYVDEAGQWMGDKAADLGAPPLVSTAIRMIPDVAASVAGLRRGGSTGPKTMAEPEALAGTAHPLQATVDAESARLSATRQAGVEAGLDLPDRVPHPQVTASNGMIQDELGLPRQTTDGAPAPITRPVLDAARTRVAGPAYNNVRKVPEFATSGKYNQAVAGINTDLINEVQRPPTNGKLSGDQAVDLSRELRARANKLYAAAKQGRPELEDAAEAHSAAAEAIEDEIRDHAAGSGQNMLAKQWDAARTYVAKTYNVESALDGAGNVVVPKLKAQLLKNKPLTGNIEKLATLGAMYPDAFKPTPAAPPPVGLLRRGAAVAIPPLATAGGALAGGMMGFPTTGAVAGERLGMRIAQKVNPTP